MTIMRIMKPIANMVRSCLGWMNIPGQFEEDQETLRLRSGVFFMTDAQLFFCPFMKGPQKIASDFPLAP
jgi:hypothetical protein